MSEGKIFAVGIGPGAADDMTPRAHTAIVNADVIIGYKTYCAQVEHITRGKTVISSGMRAEVERCNMAIDHAVQGKNVAVICSGDAGIYGMAGLILELIAARDEVDIDVEIVPGVTAATAAAAAVGAPLMNDFAVISLSDLMTSHEVIITRLKATADSGMTCVLYNPRSKKRTVLLDTALEIFTRVRGGEVAAALVRNASRENEYTWVGPLSGLRAAEVDMSTVIIIGSPNTVIRNGRMTTPRGYKIGDVS